MAHSIVRVSVVEGPWPRTPNHFRWRTKWLICTIVLDLQFFFFTPFLFFHLKLYKSVFRRSVDLRLLRGVGLRRVGVRGRDFARPLDPHLGEHEDPSHPAKDGVESDVVKHRSERDDFSDSILTMGLM